jgi:hypothetical protein
MMGYSQYENFVTLVNEDDGERETPEQQAHGAPLCCHAGHGHQGVSRAAA